MRLGTQVENLLDRWSTCPRCHHKDYVATCTCTDDRCVGWGERNGRNTNG